MQKIAIIMNSPYLGGAERSIVHQVNKLKGDFAVDYFLPFLKSEKDIEELEKFILSNSKKSTHIKKFYYPTTVFSASRFARLNPFFLFGLLKLKIIGSKLKLEGHDYIWANGMKAGLLAILTLFSQNNYKGRFIWHFRDYPKESWKFSLLKKALNPNIKKTIVGNSQSVTKSLKASFKSEVDLVCLYNPSGMSLKKRNIKQIKTLATASMITPWKGLHQVILMAHFCEKKLTELGIEDIFIFGKDIYKTENDQRNYTAQLLKLLDRFPSTLVKFKGKENPEKIFSSTDLLIHSSVDPEPFGRVIVEAFSRGVPVLSTGLGGAGELVENLDQRYHSYDSWDLFNKIQELVVDESLRSRATLEGERKIKELEQLIEDSLDQILLES